MNIYTITIQTHIINWVTWLSIYNRSIFKEWWNIHDIYGKQSLTAFHIKSCTFWCLFSEISQIIADWNWKRWYFPTDRLSHYLCKCYLFMYNISLSSLWKWFYNWHTIIRESIFFKCSSWFSDFQEYFLRCFCNAAVPGGHSQYCHQ